MADVDELFGLVVVEAAVTAHLDVDEEVGLRELGHEERVLTDHDRTGAGEQGVVVEVDVVGSDHVEQLCLERLVVLLDLCLPLMLLPLCLVVVTTDIDAYKQVAWMALDAVQGDGVDDTAVDEDHIVATHRLVE